MGCGNQEPEETISNQALGLETILSNPERALSKGTITTATMFVRHGGIGCFEVQVLDLMYM